MTKPNEHLNAAYDELKQIAAAHLKRGVSDASLSTTSLVHEAYLRLSKQNLTSYQNRSHFLGIAATLMRRILVDQARANQRLKRGGNFEKMELEENSLLSLERISDVLALDEALQELQMLDERQAKIIEMRFFGGMTISEVAEVLGVSTRTVDNEWKVCRAWLRRKLEGKTEH